MAASSPVSAVGTQLHGFNVRENLIQQEFDLSGFSLWQATDIFNGLMDDGMRTIFTMGTILTILEEVSILSKKTRLAKVFGPFWNYFDAAGYYAAMIVKLHQKNYWGAFCDFFMGTMLAALTAVCFAKFGGFAFAACMWDSFFRSLPDLVTSLSNASDDYALMCGVTTKSEKAYLKIKSIDEKLAGSGDLSAGDVGNLKAQRKTFAADYKRYATQARALHDTLKCEHRDNERTDEQNELLEEVDQYLNSSQSYLIHDSHRPARELQQDAREKLYGLPEHTPAQKQKIADELRLQAKQQAIENALNTTAWACAAIGMTLTSAAVFFPPLMKVGLVFIGIAAAIKISQVLFNTLIPMGRAYFQRRSEKKAFHAEQVATGGALGTVREVFADVSNEQLCRFRVLYFYSRKSLWDYVGSSDDGDKELALEKAFYEQVIFPKWNNPGERKKLKKACDVAMQQYVQQRLLAKAFDVQIDPEGRFIEEVDAITVGMNKEQKERIVKPSILRDTHRFFTPARAGSVEMASALDIQDETSDRDVASAIGGGALA